MESMIDVNPSAHSCCECDSQATYFVGVFGQESRHYCLRHSPFTKAAYAAGLRDGSAGMGQQVLANEKGGSQRS